MNYLALKRNALASHKNTWGILNEYYWVKVQSEKGIYYMIPTVIHSREQRQNSRSSKKINDSQQVGKEGMNKQHRGVSV